MPIELLARREIGQQQTGEFDFHPSSHSRFIRFLYTQINIMSRKKVNTMSARSKLLGEVVGSQSRHVR